LGGGFVLQDTGVVDLVMSGKVIASIDHEILTPDDLLEWDPGDFHALPGGEANLAPTIFLGHPGNPGQQMGGDASAGQTQT
jgi:hypothetical protein